jgi:uncharacterized membrane protein
MTPARPIGGGPLRHLRAHPALSVATVAGGATGLFAPGAPALVTRCLIGWNVGVWLYLLLIALMMAHADHGRLRRIAMDHAEGARAVLVMVVLAALFSFGAVVLELSAAKASGARQAVGPIALVLLTVVGSWVLLPVLFGLSYASSYHVEGNGSGLAFPPAQSAFEPDYSDFLYFSFTIAVAAQTSDVAVTTRPMRRLVLVHSVLSFVFNTLILAFAINMAAGLF